MFDSDIEAQLTKQDYTPTQRIGGVEVIDLKEFADDGGSFLEMGRLDAGHLQGASGLEVRQINYSVVLPGAIKATHLHKKQVDFWFVPSHDRLLVGLKDIRSGSATEGVVMRFVLGAGRARMVRIPNGVAHGVANPYERPMSLIYFVTEQFNSNSKVCDEFRLPPEYFGTGFWEIKAG
ncbi:dTDP-4-dehydrorhamnose 3,5-epimerase family protein [Candidatus Uhrbacteria bacterium]|nr:dTDP-4-dehydrorhamnose 3,5-epimerase family protein [Candidatus Uhrbacteria bacterium]